MGSPAAAERSPTDRAPAWTVAAGSALAAACSRVRMIAATTPMNLRAELDRLAAAWSRERGGGARFEYGAPADFSELRSGLLRAADVLEENGELGAIYAARARELADEAGVCAAVGTAAFREAARRRFARRDEFDSEADALAKKWLDGWEAGGARDVSASGARLLGLEEGVGRAANELVRSDDEQDSRSLVTAMRRAVGARKLPLRVVVMRELAPLAATGEGVVQVAAGRMISPRDVARTVLHEIEGHAAPGERARTLSLSIFAIGTARGADDQEGRALLLERAAGFLDPPRRRELALRHVAARGVEEGATFVDAARIVADFGAPVPDALRIAARVSRGGGLAREVVYLPALLRVDAALRADPHIDAVLSAGRVAVGAAPALRAWAAVDSM
jgi:hypothetical protein